MGKRIQFPQVQDSGFGERLAAAKVASKPSAAQALQDAPERRQQAKRAAVAGGTR